MSNNKPTESCNIKILDKEYAINCDESERKMLLKSADFLNNKIKETRTGGNVSGGERIIVMTALNIVYDLLKSSTDQLDDNQVARKLDKINKKIESGLVIHQQIELS